MDFDTNTSTTKNRGRSPSLAAALSFLWPGLGQLYEGKRRLAAVFAAPAVLALLLLVYQLRAGAVVFAARIFADRTFGLAAVAILLLLCALRAASVALAFLGGERRRTRRIPERLILVALVAVIVLSHAGVGYFMLTASNAGAQVFSPPEKSSLIDLTPPSGSVLAGQTQFPPLKPPSLDSRVTILFTGVDSDPSRQEHLYDSIMVVSYDPHTNSVQMVSVPRDEASYPMYYGNHPVVRVTTRINSIPTYVKNGWIQSPDSPYMTLVNEVSYLVGIPIDYYAVMDLAGFASMIDKVGGIDVVNSSAIDDPSYDWLDGKTFGFQLNAGPQHLTGKQALAYVRTRHGAGDNDWHRESRQQEVLVSLLHRMAQPSQLLNLPTIISTLGSNIATNFPAQSVADYVGFGQNVPSGNFNQVVLGPPTYTILNVNHVDSASTTCLLNDKVAALSIQLFGKDSTWYGKPAPANTCPPSY
jgi:LCP family protein required for cell wall assembly